MKLSNRMEDNYHLSNKKALFYNLKFYFDYIQKDVFKVIPVTFHIKKGIHDPQYEQFLEYYYHKSEMMHKKAKKNNY